MKAKVESARGAFKKRRRLTMLVAGAAMAALFVVFAVSSSAVISPSQFEGNDGNMVVNTSGNTDWQNVGNVVTNADVPSGSNDNSFTQGSKEDDLGVNISTGSI